MENKRVGDNKRIIEQKIAGKFLKRKSCKNKRAGQLKKTNFVVLVVSNISVNF